MPNLPTVLGKMSVATNHAPPSKERIGKARSTSSVYIASAQAAPGLFRQLRRRFMT